VIRVVQEAEKGAWPRVVNNAVVSGEVRQILATKDSSLTKTS